MNTSPEAHVALLDSCARELRILQSHPYNNALIEGAADATDLVLGALCSKVRKPICAAGHGALDLPRGDTPTVILRDVSALSTREQRRLLTWLEGDGLRSQVLSTTAYPLFRLVGRRLFDASLYYRLNVLRLRLVRSASDDHVVHIVDEAAQADGILVRGDSVRQAGQRWHRDSV